MGESEVPVVLVQKFTLIEALIKDANKTLVHRDAHVIVFWKYGIWFLCSLTDNLLGNLYHLFKRVLIRGWGIERLIMVMNEHSSVFQTDLFWPLIEKMQEITGCFYDDLSEAARSAFSCIIADHARSSAIAIADGAMPSNEGRGYVIRKIIRRAALFEHKLSKHSLIIPVVKQFIALMAPVYPELIQREKLIVSTIQSEVERFCRKSHKWSESASVIY